MAFDHHVFISYAHIDNQPLPPETQGWVSRFHADLEAHLSMRMGRKADIWRDPKLPGNAVFWEEIAAQLGRTAVLVSVLTPRYVESESCTQEIRGFYKEAEKTGVVVQNKSRIFKVIKDAGVDENPLPPLVKQMLGYEFFTWVEETPVPLGPTWGPELAQKYTLKLHKLAWDIAQLLRPKPPADKPGPAVYLAECSHDRREAREALETDLRVHGYTILPDRRLPSEEGDYAADVARLLDQCQMSIHLVGSSYGAVPDGPSEKSVVVLQNELAIQRSKSGGLRRVIWIPEGTESQNIQQQRFIEALHKDAGAQFGAELITADLETLKRAVYAALKPERSKPEPDPKLVYLICDERDRSPIMTLRKFLRREGLENKIPVFEGDAATVRQANQDLLTQCHAVILYYGAGDEAWKRTVENDLKKAKGYRDGRPLLASYTYLAEPLTSDKKDLIELEEPNLINGLEGFSEAEMKPFLSTLQRPDGSSGRMTP